MNTTEDTEEKLVIITPISFLHVILVHRDLHWSINLWGQGKCHCYFLGGLKNP